MGHAGASRELANDASWETLSEKANFYAPLTLVRIWKEKTTEEEIKKDVLDYKIRIVLPQNGE